VLSVKVPDPKFTARRPKDTNWVQAQGAPAAKAWSPKLSEVRKRTPRSPRIVRRLNMSRSRREAARKAREPDAVAETAMDVRNSFAGKAQGML